MANQNCWEVHSCGRQPGGAHVHNHGVCPAATETSSNGINGGKNAGRICWAVTGTLCGSEVPLFPIQGTHAQKPRSCLTCNFYQQVKDEEGSAPVMKAPHHAI